MVVQGGSGSCWLKGLRWEIGGRSEAARESATRYGRIRKVYRGPTRPALATPAWYPAVLPASGWPAGLLDAGAAVCRTALPVIGGSEWEEVTPVILFFLFFIFIFILLK